MNKNILTKNPMLSEIIMPVIGSASKIIPFQQWLSLNAKIKLLTRSDFLGTNTDSKINLKIIQNYG